MLIKKYINSNGIAAGPDIRAGRSAEDRLLCKQEAMGSNPIRSITIFHSSYTKISLTSVQILVGKNVDMVTR